MASKRAQQLAIGYFRAYLHILSFISLRKAAQSTFRIFSTPYRRSKKTMPAIFNQAESISFDLDGIFVQGYRWNYPRKLKLLILHGFESTAFNFEQYISPLLIRGYEVMAFDAPAHGQSGGKTIVLPQYVRMIERIEKTFGPLHAFVSHSFGGLALSQFLEKHPHGPDTRVVFIAPATETTTAIHYFFGLLRLNVRTQKAFLRYITEKASVPPSHFSITRVAPRIKANVLWIHDEDDDITPIHDTLPIREAAYPGFHFLNTHGLGHRRIYRDEMVIKSVISFLDPTDQEF